MKDIHEVTTLIQSASVHLIYSMDRKLDEGPQKRIQDLM